MKKQTIKEHIQCAYNRGYEQALFDGQLRLSLFLRKIFEGQEETKK